MSEMYVNVRNSQLVRSQSVIPSGMRTTSQSSTGSGSHYKRPSIAYKSTQSTPVPNSIIKTRSNTVNSITTTIIAGGPRLPPLPRLSTASRNSSDSNKNANSSNGNPTSRFGPPPESLMRGLESSTSNSVFHGIILILIMATSLASFIGALLYDFCEYRIHCAHSTHMYFTITSILSCTFCFLIYFLHLVGQCDYVTWSAKRKVTIEILFTMIMFIVVLVCIITATYHTVWDKSKNSIATIISIVFLMVSAICYVIRILSLALEVRMLRTKPPSQPESPEIYPGSSNTWANRKMSIKSCTSNSTNFATIAHPPPYSAAIGYNPKASFSRNKSSHDVIREIGPNGQGSSDGFPRSHNLSLIEDDEVFLEY